MIYNLLQYQRKCLVGVGRESKSLLLSNGLHQIQLIMSRQQITIYIIRHFNIQNTVTLAFLFYQREWLVPQKIYQS